MSKRIPYSFNKRGDLISDPKIGLLVWYCDNEPDMRLVIINDGQYLDKTYGRLSNFWYWQEVFEDGTLGREEYGYGHFYNYNGEYEVHRRVRFK